MSVPNNQLTQHQTTGPTANGTSMAPHATASAIPLPGSQKIYILTGDLSNLQRGKANSYHDASGNLNHLLSNPDLQNLTTLMTNFEQSNPEEVFETTINQLMYTTDMTNADVLMATPFVSAPGNATPDDFNMNDFLVPKLDADTMTPSSQPSTGEGAATELEPMDTSAPAAATTTPMSMDTETTNAAVTATPMDDATVAYLLKDSTLDVQAEHAAHFFLNGDLNNVIRPQSKPPTARKSPRKDIRRIAPINTVVRKIHSRRKVFPEDSSSSDSDSEVETKVTKKQSKSDNSSSSSSTSSSSSSSSSSSVPSSRDNSPPRTPRALSPPPTPAVINLLPEVEELPKFKEPVTITSCIIIKPAASKGAKHIDAAADAKTKSNADKVADVEASTSGDDDDDEGGDSMDEEPTKRGAISGGAFSAPASPCSSIPLTVEKPINSSSDDDEDEEEEEEADEDELNDDDADDEAEEEEIRKMNEVEREEYLISINRKAHLSADAQYFATIKENDSEVCKKLRNYLCLSIPDNLKIMIIQALKREQLDENVLAFTLDFVVTSTKDIPLTISEEHVKSHDEIVERLKEFPLRHKNKRLALKQKAFNSPELQLKNQPRVTLLKDRDFENLKRIVPKSINDGELDAEITPKLVRNAHKSVDVKLIDEPNVTNTSTLDDAYNSDVDEHGNFDMYLTSLREDLNRSVLDLERNVFARTTISAQNVNLNEKNIFYRSYQERQEFYLQSAYHIVMTNEKRAAQTKYRLIYSEPQTVKTTSRNAVFDRNELRDCKFSIPYFSELSFEDIHYDETTVRHHRLHSGCKIYVRNVDTLPFIVRSDYHSVNKDSVPVIQTQYPNNLNLIPTWSLVKSLKLKRPVLFVPNKLGDALATSSALDVFKQVLVTKTINSDTSLPQYPFLHGAIPARYYHVAFFLILTMHKQNPVSASHPDKPLMILDGLIETLCCIYWQFETADLINTIQREKTFHDNTHMGVPVANPTNSKSTLYVMPDDPNINHVAPLACTQKDMLRVLLGTINFHRQVTNQKKPKILYSFLYQVAEFDSPGPLSPVCLLYIKENYSHILASLYENGNGDIVQDARHPYTGPLKGIKYIQRRAWHKFMKVNSLHHYRCPHTLQVMYRYVNEMFLRLRLRFCENVVDEARFFSVKAPQALSILFDTVPGLKNEFPKFNCSLELSNHIAVTLVLINRHLRDFLGQTVQLASNPVITPQILCRFMRFWPQSTLVECHKPFTDGAHLRGVVLSMLELEIRTHIQSFNVSTKMLPETQSVYIRFILAVFLKMFEQVAFSGAKTLKDFVENYFDRENMSFDELQDRINELLSVMVSDYLSNVLLPGSMTSSVSVEDYDEEWAILDETEDVTKWRTPPRETSRLLNRYIINEVRRRENKPPINWCWHNVYEDYHVVYENDDEETRKQKESNPPGFFWRVLYEQAQAFYSRQQAKKQITQDKHSMGLMVENATISGEQPTSQTTNKTAGNCLKFLTDALLEARHELHQQKKIQKLKKSQTKNYYEYREKLLDLIEKIEEEEAFQPKRIWLDCLPPQHRDANYDMEMTDEDIAILRKYVSNSDDKMPIKAVLNLGSDEIITAHTLLQYGARGSLIPAMEGRLPVYDGSCCMPWCEYCGARSTYFEVGLAQYNQNNTDWSWEYLTSLEELYSEGYNVKTESEAVCVEFDNLYDMLTDNSVPMYRTFFPTNRIEEEDWERWTSKQFLIAEHPQARDLLNRMKKLMSKRYTDPERFEKVTDIVYVAINQFVDQATLPARRSEQQEIYLAHVREVRAKLERGEGDIDELCNLPVHITNKRKAFLKSASLNGMQVNLPVEAYGTTYDDYVYAQDEEDDDDFDFVPGNKVKRARKSETMVSALSSTKSSNAPNTEIVSWARDIEREQAAEMATVTVTAQEKHNANESNAIDSESESDSESSASSSSSSSSSPSSSDDEDEPDEGIVPSKTVTPITTTPGSATPAKTCYSINDDDGICLDEDEMNILGTEDNEVAVADRVAKLTQQKLNRKKKNSMYSTTVDEPVAPIISTIDLDSDNEPMAVTPKPSVSSVPPPKSTAAVNAAPKPTKNTNTVADTTETSVPPMPKKTATPKPRAVAPPPNTDMRPVKLEELFTVTPLNDVNLEKMQKSKGYMNFKDLFVLKTSRHSKGKYYVPYSEQKLIAANGAATKKRGVNVGNIQSHYDNFCPNAIEKFKPEYCFDSRKLEFLKSELGAMTAAKTTNLNDCYYYYTRPSDRNALDMDDPRSFVREYSVIGKSKVEFIRPTAYAMKRVRVKCYLCAEGTAVAHLIMNHGEIEVAACYDCGFALMLDYYFETPHRFDHKDIADRIAKRKKAPLVFAFGLYCEQSSKTASFNVYNYRAAPDKSIRKRRRNNTKKSIAVVAPPVAQTDPELPYPEILDDEDLNLPEYLQKRQDAMLARFNGDEEGTPIEYKMVKNYGIEIINKMVKNYGIEIINKMTPEQVDRCYEHMFAVASPKRCIVPKKRKIIEDKESKSDGIGNKKSKLTEIEE